jgi:hypothetical protein
MAIALTRTKQAIWRGYNEPLNSSEVYKSTILVIKMLAEEKR